jgi:DMSO/TMAO reductase YedYZ molybdopterin-dependent catalytic subunit
MSFRTRTPSIFRPKKPIDQSVLTQNRELIEAIDRRGVLRGAISLGALTLLTGCDVTEEEPVQKALRAVSAWNDRVQAAIFRPDHLAPTFPAAQVVKPPRFNAYYDIEDVKPVDGASWKLELAGRIADKRPWTAQQLYALPEQEIIIRHICVEGWDYIGQWSGVNLKSFLQRVGADLTAKYVYFTAPTTTPRASTWRRRCIRRPSSPPDTPTRPSPIRSAIRCGCGPRPSSATRMRNGSGPSRSTNDFTETFWSKQGFNWFAGI